MSDKPPSTPGTLLLGQILIADEPAHVHVTVFADEGSAMLTFNLREGSEVGQIMLGLSPHQVMQLIERLSAYSDVCGRAIAEGRGGVRFPDMGAPGE